MPRAGRKVDVVAARTYMRDDSAPDLTAMMNPVSRELEAQTDARQEQQRENGPAHHAQPSARSAGTSFQTLVI